MSKEDNSTFSLFKQLSHSWMTISSRFTNSQQLKLSNHSKAMIFNIPSHSNTASNSKLTCNMLNRKAEELTVRRTIPIPIPTTTIAIIMQCNSFWAARPTNSIIKFTPTATIIFLTTKLITLATKIAPITLSQIILTTIATTTTFLIRISTHNRKQIKEHSTLEKIFGLIYPARGNKMSNLL